jgi:hypothetical protein
MKAFLMFLSLSLPLSSFAGSIVCGQPGTQLASEFCSISYKTLSGIVAMQINNQVSSSLDVTKMEAALRDGTVQDTDLQGELWKDASTKGKANISFKILLAKSGQTDLYQELRLAQNDKTTMPSMKTTVDNSTGTRGGGFGNETYILPNDFFWID